MKKTSPDYSGSRVLFGRFTTMSLPGILSAANIWACLTLSAGDSRSEFLKLIERPRVPLAAVVHSSRVMSNYFEIRFSFAAEMGQRVPGILIKPAHAAGPLPVVISLHGTGGDKSGQVPFLRQMVNRGFAGVAIDGRYHGERTGEGKGSAAYQAAILRAWHGSGENPFFIDTVWDIQRLLDYLETRDDVDARRIGMIGISKGGVETYLAAAVDPRIAVAIPCIGVQSFRWALDHETWHSRIGTVQSAFDEAAREAGVDKPDAAFVRRFYQRIARGIDGPFDGPAMLPLIAPRPLLVINGDSDDRTPLPGLKECTDAARTAYQIADADVRFEVRLQENTGHKVTPDSFLAAADWFDPWLKPTPAASP